MAVPWAIEGSKRYTLAAAPMVCLLLAGCGTATPSTLDPRGPQAEQIAWLFWLLFALGAGVSVIVLLALFYAVFRPRPDQPEGQADVVNGRRLIVLGGIILPLLVLPAVWFATLGVSDGVSFPANEPTLTVEVTGHQWWYEVHYPEQQITLTNEMLVPVGEPVAVRVTSEDVIHSFWVPQLMGKIDMIPGTVNERWLEASEPGSYRVKCAEFCGLGHAFMEMWVEALSPEEFDDWLANESAG